MSKTDFWKKKNASKSKQFAQTPETNKIHEKSTHKWIYGKGITNPELKIATWNVNGIRNVCNRRLMEPYLLANQIDIICVHETKINREAYEKAPLQLHGYNGYWNFCKCSAGYSGVAVFSKFLPISMEEDLPQLKHNWEGRTITLQFEKFYLISVYVPSSGHHLERLSYRVNQFDKDFAEYCNSLQKKKNVIIAGDFNVIRDEIDIYMAEGKRLASNRNPSCTLEERKNFMNFLKSGWIDSYRELHQSKVEYTWWSQQIEARKKNIGWRIDYILLHEAMRPALVSCEIKSEILGSDHCPVQAVFNLSKLDCSDPEAGKSAEQLIGSISTPPAENPSIENPSIENPSIENPSIENPSVENPSVENPIKEANKMEKRQTKDVSATENNAQNQSRPQIQKESQ